MRSVTSAGGKGKLDGVSLSFAESMSGCIRPGVCDPRLGAEIPICPDDAVRFDVRCLVCVAANGKIKRITKELQERVG